MARRLQCNILWKQTNKHKKEFKMETTINSRKLDSKITFSVPGSGYIYVDLNGQPGTLGNQICRGGGLSGSTMSYSGNDPVIFKKICQNWLKSYYKYC